ncbi:MAG: hypothetical protein KDD48_02715 [Bdellovibrionales bacterium]|nr:hypothetical protein [Bdellovibrionales bacterium]
MKFGLKTYAALAQGIALSLWFQACDNQGKARYLETSQYQQGQLNQDNNLYGASQGDVGSNQRSNEQYYGYSQAQARQCFEQCLRDENGQLMGDCPDHCAHYNFNHLRGMYYDSDLSPLVSFDTAFGASRLGANQGSPGLRQQLQTQYLQNRGNGIYYNPYQSQLFNQMYPNGPYCPHGPNDCDRMSIPNYDYAQAISRLDHAAYLYQIGAPNADTYYYGIQNQYGGGQANAKLDIDFSQIGNQFKRMGQSFVGGLRNAGVGMVNQLAGSLSGGVNANFGMQQYQVAGFSMMQDPRYSGINQAVGGFQYQSLNGGSVHPCDPMFRGTPQYEYYCKR